MRAAVRIVSLSVKQQRLGLGLSAQQQHYQTISSTERKKTGTARPRPTTNRVASIQNNPRKLIGAATTRRGLDRDLVELLKALGHTLPISCPLITNDRSPVLNGNDFDKIRSTRPELFSRLSGRSLAVFIRYILASRFDSFTLALIEYLNIPSSDTFTSSVFNTHQQILIYQILIGLSRTKRQWLTPEDKDLLYVTDTANSKYFERLLELSGSKDLSCGLGPEDLRCVMRSLRRSNHPLFWDHNLIRHIWQEIVKTDTNDNRRRTNARLGIRSILHWISVHNQHSTVTSDELHPEGGLESQPHQQELSPGMWSLCLQVWSQLLDWGEIVREDLVSSTSSNEEQVTTNVLSPADQAILTMLSPIIRSAIRAYTNEPLSRDNHKLFKNACEALQLLMKRSTSSETSSAAVEELIPQLTKTFLKVLHIDHRAPAPKIVSILVQYPSLITVTQRWSSLGISESDYKLYQETLDSLYQLGRAELLVDFWVSLLPLINVSKTGWTIDKLLDSLTELSNPLVRSISGKPLNGFKYARLILKIIEVLKEEHDSRLMSSRRKAFRLIFEQRDLHKFDWLKREERRFDRDGIEITVQESEPANEQILESKIEMIIELWNSSWKLTPRRTKEEEDTQEPEPILLLSTLIGVTKLVENIRTEKTLLLLKMVVSRFIADRTPPLTPTQSRSKYLINPNPILTDYERTKLIESHLIIGNELSNKFIIDLFQDFIRSKIIPSVHDLKLLHTFLLKLNPVKTEVFWNKNAGLVNGLPWDLTDLSAIKFPNPTWDSFRIHTANHVFRHKINKLQNSNSSYNPPKSHPPQT
ncbi:hypothetical protein PSTG_01997 [Puccinia striiformis f. sp. tritici PST-78]|uniref:Uncharacterized protein n=1 Tax=Puccinia striiformis f. sp. tritici PST-78 TaxID=1165861 RepID=A0A0L0W0A6_9BASI|nr:hypothetical protein PSTG_01997 [Puccinia striiformis f. sp. tritici PST-78]